MHCNVSVGSVESSHAYALSCPSAVTVPMLQSFVELFLSHLHLEILLHGNMTHQQALDLVIEVEALLVHTQPLLPSQQLMLREVKLPSSKYNCFNQCVCVCVCMCVDCLGNPVCGYVPSMLN